VAHTTGAPYSLRVPDQFDVADVPADIYNLAVDVGRELDKKTDFGTVSAYFQRKITVQSYPPPAGTGSDGDVWFVV